MRQWSIDAFAEAAFKGNPACVLEPFDAWPPSAFMQALAKENNQSETAYLLKTEDPARFGLRWFTPGLEVKLCGHATLAAGVVILDELGLTGGVVTFDTLSGPLRVTRRGADYVMDFPSDPPKETATPEGLEEALGAKCSQFYAAAYGVAILENEAAVRGLLPDIAAIDRVTAGTSGGPGNVIVAAKADEGSGFDVVDRFFAPGFGIAEDPATGSAHCILAPLFGRLLGLERLRFHQAFPGRGANIATELDGDRVRLIGRGCVVAESRLRLHSTG